MDTHTTSVSLHSPGQTVNTPEGAATFTAALNHVRIPLGHLGLLLAVLPGQGKINENCRFTEPETM